MLLLTVQDCGSDGVCVEGDMVKVSVLMDIKILVAQKGYQHPVTLDNLLKLLLAFDRKLLFCSHHE